MSDQPSIIVPLFTVIFGSCVWLAYTRLQRGPMLSPSSIFIFLITSIFGVRPLIMLGTGDYQIYGIDSSLGFDMAARLGAISLVSFAAFRLLARLRGRPRTIALEPHDWMRAHPITMRFALTASVLTTLFWFGAMATIGGGSGFVATLFGGRSAQVSEALSNVPVIISAAPVAGATVAAVARLVIESSRPLDVRERLAFWVAISISTVPPLALGIRRLLLPCIIVALVAAIGRQWAKRVPIWGLAGGLLAASVLAALPYVRSAGARSGNESLFGALSSYFGENGLGGVIATFFYSNDTEMFSYVSYLTTRVGVDIPYGYGQATLIDLYWNAVPVALSNHPTWTDQILTAIYGGGCATIACPVPSVVGVLYMDGGVLAVLFGSMVLGLLLAWFDGRLTNSGSLPQLLIALIATGFMPGLVRGDTMNQVWLLLNVLIVTAGLLWMRSLTTTGSRPATGRVTRRKVWREPSRHLTATRKGSMADVEGRSAHKGMK